MSGSSANTDIERHETEPTAPEIWDPINDGAATNPLVGELLSYSRITTEFGDRLLAIIREQGTDRVWSRLVAGAVLEREFERQRPMPGELVKLEYLGEGKVQDGRFAGKDYHRWRLAVARPPQAPNWDAFAEGKVELSDATQPAEVAPIELDVPIDAETLPETASIAERADEVTEDDDDLPF